MATRLHFVLIGSLHFGGFGRLNAAEIQSLELFPSADTTLAQTAPDNNFGGADFFNAGTAHNGKNNRALIQFEVGTTLPANAIILSAELVLEVVREPREDAEASSFGLHRVLVSWGEGLQVPEAQNPGQGLPATLGEATWNDRFALSTQPWAQPGGAPDRDFAADFSSDALVMGRDFSPYVFASTPALVADVQSWLADPASNFGWLLASASEGWPGTARSFGAREGDFPPVLRVEFIVVPEPTAGALVLLGMAAWWGGRGWSRRSR